MRPRVTLAILLAAAAAAVAPGALRAQDRLEGPLARTVAPLFQGRVWRYATWGALVVSLTRGDTLLSYHADRRFFPASNTKLFTTAAALHYLGADYRFLTALFVSGPEQEGTLYGDLVLYGTGDPEFALDTADLAPFADSVVLAGIRDVRGDIVGNRAFLGPELEGPGWTPENIDQWFAAPPSALGAAENLIAITVEPGDERGTPAVVHVSPPNDYFRITSTVLTGRPRGRTRISVRRGSSSRDIALSGTIAGWRRRWTTYEVVREPAVFAASLLRSLLEARGVTISGTTRSETDDAAGRGRQLLAWAREDPASDPPPAGAIAVRRSESLGDLVSMINHRSHNLSAELVFRAVGRSVGGAGTYASGARAVTQFLSDTVGIAPADFSVSDGSGLSLLDEATPRALVQLLAYERHAPDGEVFWRSLPTAGDELEGRMEDTPAEGRLRAKTGTLKNASTLAGYVTAADGEVLAFSIMVKDAWRIQRARRVQDQIGARLAQFSR